jgi:predicted Zn-dependent protease
MNRKIIALILLGPVLFACLLVCGHFGMKMFRRTRLRNTAMTAYENKDYAQAERLLQQYVQTDPDAEAEFVALANIYHEFGNMEMEAQMWQTASSLNPQNPDYRANMMNSMVKSASYASLHGILGRKAKVDDSFTDHELYLFVISSYRSGYPKDGDDAYKRYAAKDPEVFHKNDLGRMAEFMATYETLTDSQRDVFLNGAMQSEDPDIRFEAIYFAIRRMEQRGDADLPNDEGLERLLKQAVETNYFAGTALLADFYFSNFRFAETINVLEPYLKTIDDSDLYLLYMESCAFAGKLDELKVLEQKLRQKSGFLPLLADYCEILILYLENDGKKLAASFRKFGKRIDSPLSRFIRLRVAMANESFNEILTVVQELFFYPPFYDLHNRALLICLDYIAKEMKKPENQDDPSQMADLAKILSGYLHGNQMLTELILTDQCRKDLVKEADLMDALERFPDDALLQRITADYLVSNEKPEQALSILEPILAAAEEEKQEPDRDILFLSMLAQDQLGHHGEASVIFQKMVEQSGFDPDLLSRYFLFCVENERKEDLTAMADKLDSPGNGNLKPFGKFFQAAALLLTGDKEKETEALDLLASAPDDNPEFTFYAATRLFEHGRLNEAEAKYSTITKTYSIPSLVLLNLSNLYHAKGEKKKALEAAKEAFGLDKNSMLPAFLYAKRLSEAERYEEAVDALKFPRHTVNYSEDVIGLWVDCMRHVVEKSMAGRKYLQAEEQCKHLLIIAPEDEFGQKIMAELMEILRPKRDGAKDERDEAVPAA